MQINVWQARALAEAMGRHDAPENRSNTDLDSAYATVENQVVDGEQLLVVRWDDHGVLVLWHDGTDVTDDYREVADART